MSRYRVLWILLVVAVTGALSSGRPLWWSVAGVLIALIVISVAWAWMSVNWLRISRHTLTRVAQVGETLEEEFVVHNLSRIPKLWLEVRDFSNLPDHNASRVLGVIGGKRWRGWRVSTLCRTRGRYSLGPLTVTSGDPLGIYQSRRAIPKVSSILVYPATYEFREFPLPAGYLPGGEALRRRTHAITTNAAGVRDYIHGDGFNRIHWPISARRQRLIVKEFELDPMSELWILLDLCRDAHVLAGELTDDPAETGVDEPADPSLLLPPTTEEYAVSMAASVARHFLRQGRALGLITYCQHRQALACERGERQDNKIMEVLSVARAEGQVPFERVLRAEGATLPRGSTIIAISPSTNLEWALTAQQLIRSGLRLVAVVIDAASFSSAQPETPTPDVIEAAPASSAPAPTTAELTAALAEAGAVVRVVRRGEPLALAIEQPAY